jgi:DNA-binding LacI/PurR family transcriptional regulator
MSSVRASIYQIYSIAGRAEVDWRTVRAYLNDDRDTFGSKRDRIECAIRELGFEHLSGGAK